MCCDRIAPPYHDPFGCSFFLILSKPLSLSLSASSAKAQMPTFLRTHHLALIISSISLGAWKFQKYYKWQKSVFNPFKTNKNGLKLL